MSVIDLSDQKTMLRRVAFDRRKEARSPSANAFASAYLGDHVRSLHDATIVAGYMAIQTEIDPRQALESLHEAGKRICLPVIQGKGKPLLFREWSPGAAMIEGDFGALIPRSGDTVIPDAAIVPLVAFDDKGYRLGYGGGYYDRTLVHLRENPSFHAVGFAFAAQEMPDLPVDPYDQYLDAVVTENGIRYFADR